VNKGESRSSRPHHARSDPYHPRPLDSDTGDIEPPPSVTPNPVIKKRSNSLISDTQLHQSEQRFQLMVEAVQDYAIFMLDAQGHVSTWNIGAERLKGYDASEIIGQHFSIFYPEGDVRSRKPQWELEVAAQEGRFEDEGWRVRKDGSRFWANVIITALRDETGKLIGFGKVTRDFTARMQAEEALRQANKELAGEIEERRLAQARLAKSERALRDLSVHLLKTQDEERKRLARDLHDSLGQSLAVMKMSLDTLASVIATEDDEARQPLARCLRLAEDCIKEVRTMSYLLYPPMLEEMGLKSAIFWYLDGYTSRSNIKTTFEVAPDFGRLPREMELAMFRVLQESLINVHRHSGSATAHVRLSIKGATAVLEVQDQGKGIPPVILQEAGPDRISSPGVGLRGMSERLQQLGGKLEVFSNQDGTTISAMVPVDESNSTSV
jgi:PAS domain S-box-containing protein